MHDSGNKSHNAAVEGSTSLLGLPTGADRARRMTQLLTLELILLFANAGDEDDEYAASVVPLPSLSLTQFHDTHDHSLR